MTNNRKISVLVETQNEATLLLKGGIESDHERLSNRHKDSQHPISAITGLRDFATNVNNSLSDHTARINILSNEFGTEGIQRAYCNYYPLSISLEAVVSSTAFDHFPYVAKIVVERARITNDSEVSVIFDHSAVQFSYGVAFYTATNIVNNDGVNIVEIIFYFAKRPLSIIPFNLKITGGLLAYD